MQLQFHKTVCPCLQQVKREVQNQEQTQEIRLGEDMPDIGRVLGAWGQVLIRGKEWQKGAMSVSGGVMAWVLYAPEDGSAVRWVDSWIPFQFKWELPETQHDGIIRTQCLLRSLDARSTSARRLMVRASVGAMGEALLPGGFDQYTPGELPEDVELMKNTYPFQLPQEAGEKSFTLEEIFTMPPAAPKMEKLIRYDLTPSVLDKKVMGSKVVFRGTARVHIVYLTPEGMVQCWDFELPFSQYAELEGDYDPDADGEVIPAVTGLEMDVDADGNLHIKAGLTGQYMITSRNMVTVVEDAYSPIREVTVKTQPQQVPALLEQITQNIHAQQTLDPPAGTVADTAFYPDHPRILQREDGMEAVLSGVFSALYYDPEGALQSAFSRWEGSIGLTCGPDVEMQGQVFFDGNTQKEMQADMQIALTGCARQGFDMVTELELGEQKPADPNRPSLILRRTGDQKLWDIAKSTGSTVSAISEANKLTGEPEPNKMLIIPIG